MNSFLEKVRDRFFMRVEPEVEVVEEVVPEIVPEPEVVVPEEVPEFEATSIVGRKLTIRLVRQHRDTSFELVPPFPGFVVEDFRLVDEGSMLVLWASDG